MILLSLLLTESSGFVQPSSTRTSILTTSTTTAKCPQSLLALLAKATRQKKKTSPSSRSGGFGKTEKDPSSSKASNDFAAFPALEKSVAETLVSSPQELLEPGVLPAEVYERLDQIYGFPTFNFENKDKESSTAEAMSFSDLLSSSGGGDLIKQQPASENLADLLTVSPASASASSSSATSQKASTMDAIANLPPFTDFRVLHMDPLVLAIDNFLSYEECDRYVTMTTAPTSKTNDAPFQTRSKTVGKDAVAKAQRTSTTWFHHYKAVPELMAKASRLLGLDGIDQWEEPQTVR
jgi:hypothetical protein